MTTEGINKMIKKLLLKTRIPFIQDTILNNNPELVYYCPVTEDNILSIYNLMDKVKTYHELSDADKKLINKMDTVFQKHKDLPSKSKKTYTEYHTKDALFQEHTDMKEWPEIAETIHILNQLQNHNENAMSKTMTFRQLYESKSPLWAQNLFINEIELFFADIHLTNRWAKIANLTTQEKEIELNKIYDIMSKLSTSSTLSERITKLDTYRQKVIDNIVQHKMTQLNNKIMSAYISHNNGVVSTIMSHIRVK